MTLKKLLPYLVIGIIAVAVGVGALNISSASAAEATQDETIAMTAELKGDRGRGVKGFSQADLAAALGITEEELTKAIQSAKEAAVAQGVEQGWITQAQADEITADETAAPYGRLWLKWLGQGEIDFEALLADALGISVEELQDAYQTATFAAIDQAVADGKLTEEQALLAKGRYALRADSDFQAAMQTAYETAIAQAVKSGVITQEQADLILENASTREFGGSRSLPGLFMPDRMGGKPGHADRAGEWDSTQTTPTTEP